jgi:hypothetical protein
MLVSPGGGDAVMRQGLEIPTHDHITNSYTGTNLTQTVFRRGGASGTVVATLTMTYDGSDNLLTVARS